MTALQKVHSLDDKTLIARLASLADTERVGQVDLLLFLGELDDRRLYLGLGYSSLWDYCRRALKFSESISQQRIIVGRAARKFPAILPMLANGRLTICTAADLAPTLTDANAEALLAAAAGKSRREIQDLTDARAVKPKERDVIRRMGPILVVAPAVVPMSVFDTASGPAPVPATDLMLSSAPAEPEARHRVAFSASAEVVKKLERLMELLGNAKLEEAVGKAADSLLDKLDPARREVRRQRRREKKVATPAPKLRKPKCEPRHPPRALRDATILADGQRCAFVSSEGVRCSETRFLTIDHIQPYALGGTSTDPSNLRCLCAGHNQYFARQTFGGLVPYS